MKKKQSSLRQDSPEYTPEYIPDRIRYLLLYLARGGEIKQPLQIEQKMQHPETPKHNAPRRNMPYSFPGLVPTNRNTLGWRLTTPWSATPTSSNRKRLTRDASPSATTFHRTQLRALSSKPNRPPLTQLRRRRRRARGDEGEASVPRKLRRRTSFVLLRARRTSSAGAVRVRRPCPG